MAKVGGKCHASMGMIWIIGWIFTIGFVRLAFWRGVLAIIIWPYYLGVTIAALMRH